MQKATYRFQRLLTIGLVAGTSVMLASSSASARPPVRPAITAKPSNVKAPSIARLAYDFQPGKSYPYRVLLLLDGHVPGLSLSDGPPVHILADLTYVANVVKRDDKGADIDFSVEAAKLGFLEKEAGADGKLGADNAEIPYGIPLNQVQGMFNVKALVRPDGSIASVTGGSSPLRIEIGVDLRKLFISAILPVVFPKVSVKPGEVWTFEEGALGKKPGATTYQAHVQAIRPEQRAMDFDVVQAAHTQISSKLDKEGNSTDNSGAAVGTLDGEVTANGTMQFAANSPAVVPAADLGPLFTGRQTTGQLTLNIVLKKVMPDIEHPGQKVVTPIDARARLFVSPAEKTGSDQKPASQTPAKTPTKPVKPRKVNK